ncbi:MAG: pyridoxamine 5'-phosphate oxidase family protein [Chitinophagaceae bacterium]|nr:pyridoxamine 5'-phosphate oxidase family protein [Chitinophagaceae bacterium]
MFGKLNKEEIEEVIKRQLFGRIGCYTDGLVYVVPVSYAYEDPYIYGYTFEGMKIDMLRKNPSICFQIDDTKNLANWKSIIAWGEFEELVDTTGRNHALQKLEERVLPIINSETMHVSPIWPFSTNNPDALKGIVFRIRLKEKTGRFEKSPDSIFYAT